MIRVRVAAAVIAVFVLLFTGLLWQTTDGGAHFVWFTDSVYP
ncbi:hypothetical protein [Nocardia sp. NPDC004722]